MNLIKTCKDCNKSNFCHIKTWISELVEHFLPTVSFPKKIDKLFDISLEKFFIITHLISSQKNPNISKMHLRSQLFIKEARKRGVKFKIFKGPFGYMNYFQAKYKKQIIRIDGLPTANSKDLKIGITNNKSKTRNILKNNNFPVESGKSFWFWQKKKALNFGKKLGFPLVVKPNNGSLGKHITTQINNQKTLKKAIKKAIEYSPVFVIEKFIPFKSAYRITVVDYNFIACINRLPANIIGDGKSTIKELINQKNIKEKRKNSVLYKINPNKITKELLSKKGYNFSSIPKKGERVYLKKHSQAKSGRDLINQTHQIHPENIKLFKNIAKLFKLKLVGIDFIAKDISKSWKNQKCAILELNNLPNIELHHRPSQGKPINVAKEIVKLFFKYYIKK